MHLSSMYIEPKAHIGARLRPDYILCIHKHIGYIMLYIHMYMYMEPLWYVNKRIRYPFAIRRPSRTYRYGAQWA